MWRGLALRTVPVSLYSLWLLLAAGIAAIQCVPLPAALRSMLPLASEPLLRQTLADIGGYPHKPLPLSLDPAETANEAVRLLGYVCALGVFSTLRTRHGDSYRLAGMVVMVGSLVAGLGSLAALGVTLPGTLAVTTEGQSRALWPAVLQNANHMAALLSLTAILALGMLLQTDRQARPQRFGALCAVLGLVNLALLFSLSRAGILCGLFGQLLTLLSADSPVPKTKRQRLWWVVLPSLGLLLAMLFGPAAPLVGRWRELSHGLSPAGSKVWLWQTAWPLLKAHPLTGIGRGALETALQAPTAIATTTRFTHLENEWLQALLDHGLPLGFVLWGLLFCATAQAARQLFRSSGESPTPVRRAALWALLCLGLHNLFDFNLQTGAVALSALLVTSLVQKPLFSLSARWLAGLGALVLLLAAVVQFKLPSHDEDGRRLAILAQDPTVSPSVLKQAASEALFRHPLDSYLSAVVAARLFEDDDPEAMAWTNRSLRQNPADLLARATAVRLLGRHGHQRQALAMLGPLIGEADAEKRRYLFGLLLSLSPKGTELVAALPNDEPLRLALLEFLGTQSQPNWPLLLSVASESVSRGDQAALTWLGRAALSTAQPDAAETALRGLLTRPQLEPLLIGGLLEVLLRGQKLVLAKDLAEVALRRQKAPEISIAHAQILAMTGDLDGARQSLAQAVMQTSDRLLLARLHEVRADLEQRQGHVHRAETERAEAQRLRRDAGQP